jgi:hypothetical protein
LTVSSPSLSGFSDPSTALHRAYVLVGNAIGLVARAARFTVGGQSPRELVYEADRYLEQADTLLRRAAADLEEAPSIEGLREEVRTLADPPPSRRARRDGFAEMLMRLRGLRRSIGAVLYRDDEWRRSPRSSRASGARTTLTNLLKKAPGSKRYLVWWGAAAALVVSWVVLTLGHCSA